MVIKRQIKKPAQIMNITINPNFLQKIQNNQKIIIKIKKKIIINKNLIIMIKIMNKQVYYNKNI